MSRIYLIIAGILAVLSAIYFVSKIPEHYREQGRMEERAVYKIESDFAVIRAKKQLADKELATEKERVKNAFELAKQNEKFEAYVADVRAGRIAGLRITKANICPTTRTEVAGTSGTQDQETVRLPREIEEGLFRFADDRDKIIFAFEAFKQEVRIAKCFAETKE